MGSDRAPAAPRQTLHIVLFSALEYMQTQLDTLSRSLSHTHILSLLPNYFPVYIICSALKIDCRETAREDYSYSGLVSDELPGSRVCGHRLQAP